MLRYLHEVEAAGCAFEFMVSMKLFNQLSRCVKGKSAVCYVNLVTHDDAVDTDGQKITDVIISE